MVGGASCRSDDGPVSNYDKDAKMKEFFRGYIATFAEIQPPSRIGEKTSGSAWRLQVPSGIGFQGRNFSTFCWSAGDSG